MQWSLPRKCAVARRTTPRAGVSRVLWSAVGLTLRLLGAEVRVSRAGAEALETLADFPAAAVLLDIGMPEMDGYEVARRIQERFRERRPVIVALTGWGQEQDRARARDAGFDHHLVKPAEISALKTLLASI